VNNFDGGSAATDNGYEAPHLTMHGSVHDITKALSSGANVDAMFPAGTPIGQLTFS
jgi:hypothetical protein